MSPTVAEVRAGAACTATAGALGPLGTHCRSESDCRRAEQSAGAACIAGALTAPCAVRQGREAVSRCQQRLLERLLLERPLDIDGGSKPCMHDGGGRDRGQQLVLRGLLRSPTGRLEIRVARIAPSEPGRVS